MTQWFKLGVASSGTIMKYPYLMKDWIKADDFEEAAKVFLADVSVEKDKLNDTVVLLGTASGTLKKEQL